MTRARGRLDPQGAARHLPAFGPARPHVRGERGVALAIVLMVMALLLAVAAGLTVLTSTDAFIAANAGVANEALYAAEAAFERTVGEVRDAPDLSSLLSGTVLSPFRDGPPGGVRVLADGVRIDLGQVLSLAGCHRLVACAGADLDAVREHRPWGALNPRWQLYAYGPLDPAPGGIRNAHPVYVVSMVADDPAEADGDPLRDGLRVGASANPGAGVIMIRAEAFGLRRAHRVVEGVAVRRDLAARAQWEAADPASRGSPPVSTPMMQVLGWREVR